MEAKSGRLDYWRNYFRGANSDIFEVIEYAIIVAASDCPQEFRLRRDRIAERLFSCRLTKCSGCDRIELAVPEEVEDGDLKGDFGGQGGVTTAGSGAKESKVNSSTDDRGDLHQFSNYSYNEAEALTEEIEEKSITVAEVFRIKDILSNYEEQSDSVLLESLRRLQLMQLSVGTLKITEIGKAVNGIRKHRAKNIRQLARTLIGEWKTVVDEWVNAATAITGNHINDGDSPDSVNPFGGLPSPPLDEGVFLATQTTSIELSQFFEGMDDDGYFRNIENEDFFENGRKPVAESPIHINKEQNPINQNARKENHNYLRKPEPTNKPTKISTAVSVPCRPQKPASENKSNGGNAKLQQRATDKIQKKLSPGSYNKSQLPDEEASVQVKLEATKRKLHEGYQLAQNAKRQRTIQVMELRDLPKQGLGHRNFHHKPGLHNRHFSSGRR
ncbi:probable mediator of RNA polymerase II transcription subunit 26b [Aristolochia californica]|uniref:probable mediator of RNA polymerase II transcription subunit 26b n=1 Tax=Aristolochia californica TaxID=171875 RepID=UPI0035DD0C3B